MLKISLMSVIYAAIIFFSFNLGVKLSKSIENNFLIYEGYIYSVNTPSYGDETIFYILEDFNQMGDRNAVRFDRHYYDRQIFISESDDLQNVPFFLRKPTDSVTLGRANSRLEKCTIQLKTRMDYATLRRVVIHEYLHCMGYHHVENQYDLMAPFDSNVSESNIEGYAKDLKKKLWKSLKN